MILSKTAPLLTKLSATAARKSCTLCVEVLFLFDTQPAYAGKCLLGRPSGLPSFVQTLVQSGVGKLGDQSSQFEQFGLIQFQRRAPAVGQQGKVPGFAAQFE